MEKDIVTLFLEQNSYIEGIVHGLMILKKENEEMLKKLAENK
jgi:hypothetical protein